MTVFEIYLMELSTEIFKQLRMELFLSLLNTAGNHSNYTGRGKKDCNLYLQSDCH